VSRTNVELAGHDPPKDPDWPATRYYAAGDAQIGDRTGFAVTAEMFDPPTEAPKVAVQTKVVSPRPRLRRRRFVQTSPGVPQAVPGTETVIRSSL
jgi:hypothetical protein